MAIKMTLIPSVSLIIVVLLFPSVLFAGGDSVDQETDSRAVVGQAVEITANDYYTFSAGEMFPSESGTISLWVKPSETWETTGGGYWEFINVVQPRSGATARNDIFEFRRGKDSRLDNLQFIPYPSTGRFNAWKTQDSNPFTWVNGQWYHIAVTWSSSQTPIVYVNGSKYEMVPAYSETEWTIPIITEAEIYFGQRAKYLGDSALEGLLDEVHIWNTIKSESEIQTLFSNGAQGIASMTDAATVLLVPFDESLLESVSGEKILFNASSTELYMPMQAKKATVALGSANKFSSLVFNKFEYFMKFTGWLA